MTDAGAIVIGSGPNGLAAALTMARAGVSVAVYESHDEIGGGTRSAELTLPGLIHDVCSAVHPFGVASPFFSELPLADHGLVWRHPEVLLAHPLDGDRAGLLYRSLDATADALGPDGDRWRRLFTPLVERFDDLVADVLGPMTRIPQHPLLLGRFGLPGLVPARALAALFRTAEAGGLLAGSAAHSIRPLGRPLTSAVGLLLTAAGHAVGWPVAEGGSQAIARAMASLLTAEGGVIHTGVHVSSLHDLPPANVVLFDTAPQAAVAIAGDRVPAAVASSFSAFTYGGAAFKLDLAVRGGIPWAVPECARAGVVHLGGTPGQIASAERAVHRGRLPERPFVLVGQQSVCDPTRADGDIHPVWTYAHVPRAYTGDASAAIIGQLERFAPGVRDHIVGEASMSPRAFERYNPNYVGGDVATGANTMRQMVFRPRVTTAPYTIAPGLYLCSAATPPGAGVHGMCGHLAARAALSDLVDLPRR